MFRIENRQSKFRRVVADSKDIRQDMQRIGELVQEIEAIADPAVRAATKNLVQSLMDLHLSLIHI